MPTRKKRSAKKPAKTASRSKAPAKKAAARKAPKAPAKKAPAKKAARTSPAPKQAAASSPPSHTPTPNLNGWITHTELASADPVATKTWCARVLGWTFPPPFPMQGGELYHLFTYSDKGGGGIRRNNPPEIPGSIPYVHVDDIRAAFASAISAGAEEMMPPTPVMEGVTIAIVRAPGGVPIGLSGP
jgi:predicted enzyme related to lactoylglutathione lyase